MIKFKALLSRFIEFIKSGFILLGYYVNRNEARKLRLHQELTANATWETNIGKFEKNVQLEEVQFAFKQAEKLLEDSVEDSQRIVSRTNIVMTICGGALIFLGGHIGGILSIKNIEHIQNVKILTFIRYHLTFLPGCYLAFLFLILLLRLAYHLIALDYYTVGSQPKQLFVSEYYKEDYSEIPTIIKMYLGELEEYQFRITENIAKNQKRWTEINFMIRMAVVITLEAGLIMLIELFFCI